MATYTLPGAPGEETAKQAHLCVYVVHCQTHTCTTILWDPVKNIVSLLLGNPLHTGVSVLTLNVSLLCVWGSRSYPVDCLTELLVPKQFSLLLVPVPTEEEESRKGGKRRGEWRRGDFVDP